MATLRTKYLLSMAPRISSCVRVSNNIPTAIMQAPLRNLTPSCHLTEHQTCNLFTSTRLRGSDDDDDEGDDDKREEREIIDMVDGVRIHAKRRVVKDIPVETSIRYMKSEAYRETYGDENVWVKYRRNFAGVYPPDTRKKCIRIGGIITTGSPCPVCRDDYLVVDYRNVDLLAQFICPHSGQLLTAKKTGVCQRAHLFLSIAVERSMQEGLLLHDVPFREYDYKDFYPAELLVPGYQYQPKKVSS